MALSSITDIIADMRAGKMVILVDEEDRENEGDLVLAAEFVTPEAVNFMARFGRGLICLTLTEERCRQLDLPLMVTRNGTRHGTKFTVSIEAAEGVSTGISAADRARTIQAAIARDARPEHLVQPGHVFPLRAEKGGVLVRAGHTEAGCDLAALAGLQPASVICEIMNDDGTMARLPDLIEFGRTHGLKIGTIADLIGYRSANESLVERMGESTVQTVHGEFRMLTYRDRAAGGAHLALVCGAPGPGNDALVRVQELASVIDLIDTKRGSHSWSVHKALAAIAASGCGALVLLNCSNAGAPLVGAFVGSAAPAAATGTAPQRPKMDLRSYGIGAQILRDIGVGRMKLLSRPVKLPSMGGFSLQVTGFAHEAEPGIELPISQGKSMSVEVFQAELDGQGLRIGVVQSRFNEAVCAALRESCLAELARLGVAEQDISLCTVPGALEIPFVLHRMASTGAFDALIALGAVIRGETYHFELVANESGRGIQAVATEFGLPVANAVLTTNTDEQAAVRAPVKGAEAAQVAVEMARLDEWLDSFGPPDDFDILSLDGDRD